LFFVSVLSQALKRWQFSSYVIANERYDRAKFFLLKKRDRSLSSRRPRSFITIDEKWVYSLARERGKLGRALG